MSRNTAKDAISTYSKFLARETENQSAMISAGYAGKSANSNYMRFGFKRETSSNENVLNTRSLLLAVANYVVVVSTRQQKYVL